MRKSRVIGLEHAKAAKGAAPVESYLVPYPSVKDYGEAMKGKGLFITIFHDSMGRQNRFLHPLYLPNAEF